MTPKRVCYALIAVLVLLGIGLAASVYVANRILENSSQALATHKAEDQAVATQKVQLVQAKKDLATYRELNEIARTVVPQDKDQAKTVREISKLATDSGIGQLGSIAFNPSTLGGAQTKTPNGLTQVTPVKGLPGVFTLDITVQQAATNSVPYGNFITFLNKLEQNRRTAQVSSIAVQPDPKNPGLVAFTLVINEYLKP